MFLGHCLVQYVLRAAFASWIASLPVPGTSLADVAAAVGVLDVASLRSAWAEVLRDAPGCLPPLADDAIELPSDVAAAAVTTLTGRLLRLITLEYVHPLLPLPSFEAQTVRRQSFSPFPFLRSAPSSYACASLPVSEPPAASRGDCASRYLIPDLVHLDTDALESMLLPALQSGGATAIPATVLPGAAPVANWLVLGSRADVVKQVWDKETAE